MPVHRLAGNHDLLRASARATSPSPRRADRRLRHLDRRAATTARSSVDWLAERLAEDRDDADDRRHAPPADARPACRGSTRSASRPPTAPRSASCWRRAPQRQARRRRPRAPRHRATRSAAAASITCASTNIAVGPGLHRRPSMVAGRTSRRRSSSTPCWTRRRSSPTSSRSEPRAQIVAVLVEARAGGGGSAGARRRCAAAGGSAARRRPSRDRLHAELLGERERLVDLVDRAGRDLRRRAARASQCSAGCARSTRLERVGELVGVRDARRRWSRSARRRPARAARRPRTAARTCARCRPRPRSGGRRSRRSRRGRCSGGGCRAGGRARPPPPTPSPG